MAKKLSFRKKAPVKAAPAQDTNPLAEHVTKTLAIWKKNPGKMFEWRSRMFRMIMIILEEIITRDPGGSRTKENARVRAIGQFQQVAAAMEEYRMDTPVVCPHCAKEFDLQ